MLETTSFRCMTTDIELFLDARDARSARGALEQAERFFYDVEARFSRFLPESELSRLNRIHDEDVPVASDLAELIGKALAAARTSEGIFDPTVIDALEAAGYDRSIELVRGNGTHPRGEVAPHPDTWRNVVVDTKASTVRLPAGVRLDLGGIGKGWAADRASEILRPLGAGMVNAGGDIRAWGDQPGAVPGEGWLVAVEDPEQPGIDLVWLRVRDGALATSSITRRRWSGGHHLINPRTARPADTNLLSVTALGPTVVRAEVAAKVALILGREAGLDWLAAQRDVEAVAVDDGGELFGTAGIEEELA
jgi:thiamine biosynthesis lipoprotein